MCVFVICPQCIVIYQQCFNCLPSTYLHPLVVFPLSANNVSTYINDVFPIFPPYIYMSWVFSISAHGVSTFVSGVFIICLVYLHMLVVFDYLPTVYFHMSVVLSLSATVYLHKSVMLLLSSQHVSGVFTICLLCIYMCQRCFDCLSTVYLHM